MMKRIIAAAILVLSILFLPACSGNRYNSLLSEEPYFPEIYQVKNHADGTISSFGLNIASADEMGDWVVNWISGTASGDGFQYLIYSDPDSWDVYLYVPRWQAEIKMLTNSDVTVEYSDHTLHVYVTSPTPEDVSDIPEIPEENCVLHFAAPPFGAWPSNIAFYWDDCEILCDAMSIHQ